MAAPEARRRAGSGVVWASQPCSGASSRVVVLPLSQHRLQDDAHEDDATPLPSSRSRSLALLRPWPWSCSFRPSRPSAHHAFSAEFDATKPVRLARPGDEGRVGEPARLDSHRRHRRGRHGDGMDGRVRPAGRPGAAGLEEALGGAGDRSAGRGLPGDRWGVARANGRDVTLPDGRRLFAGSSGTGAPYDDRESG